MRARASLPASAAAVLLLVPGWTGEVRRPVPAAGPAAVRVRAAVLDPADPARRRVGGLLFLGGVSLDSDAKGFGGYSALAVPGRGAGRDRGRRFVLLSDRGALLRFRLRGGRVEDARVDPLPAGPGTGWTQDQRDSESLTLSPDGRDARVAFERFNQVWRYRVGADGRWRAIGGTAPAPMARWRRNGGAESMARLADGRFLLLAESGAPGDAPGTRTGLVFAGDPARAGTRFFRFAYRPAAGFDPADAVQLSDGRVAVLERRFRPFNRWSSRIAVFPASAMRPGAAVVPRELARLAPPLATDNFEGLAATREGGRTVLWLVSDDNQRPWQRTLIYAFALRRDGVRRPDAR